MKPTQQLHDLGQSLWLDNITRGILNDGTLARYIRDYDITGLTSNPTIFDLAIKDSGDYDEAILEKSRAGKSGEALFMELALEDLTRAADLFRPAHEASKGLDGWVSLEPRGRSGPRRSSMAGPSGQISSSRFRARARASLRSRSRSSPACRST